MLACDVSIFMLAIDHRGMPLTIDIGINENRHGPTPVRGPSRAIYRASMMMSGRNNRAKPRTLFLQMAPGDGRATCRNRLNRVVKS